MGPEPAYLALRLRPLSSSFVPLPISMSFSFSKALLAFHHAEWCSQSEPATQMVFRHIRFQETAVCDETYDQNLFPKSKGDTCVQNGPAREPTGEIRAVSGAIQTAHSGFLKPWVINILGTEFVLFIEKQNKSLFLLGGGGELLGVFCCSSAHK